MKRSFCEGNSGLVHRASNRRWRQAGQCSFNRGRITRFACPIAIMVTNAALDGDPRAVGHLLSATEATIDQGCENSF